jgi:hypothetical protein
MNNRYCVLSIPRTGSTWLTEGIYGALCSTNSNVMNLGEFFTLPSNLGSSAIRTKYNVDEQGLLKKQIQSTPCLENLEKALETFIDGRLLTLLNADKNQSVVFKYMYWTRPDERINDLENLKKIKNHGFTIVNINRDPFESAISFLVGKKTNFWIKSTLWSNKNIKPMTKSSITLSSEDFKSTYETFLNMTEEKQKISDELNCVSVNYESLKDDCYSNQIPFKEENTCKKVYNIDYCDIITNYDDLVKIKEQMSNQKL